ncbi:MAG: hypothetical protein M3Q97_07900 [Bacteroidota bacterium]|nr:hypothetical protein [Bacteroidota bacterium]
MMFCFFKYLVSCAVFLVVFPYTMHFSANAQSRRIPQEEFETASDTFTKWQALRQRLLFGGNFGASFGTGGTFIEVSPAIAYKVTKRVTTGIGGTYMYQSWRDMARRKYHTSVYGSRIFTQYAFVPAFFLHGEYERLNAQYIDFFTGEFRRKWIGNALAGAGYRSYLGPRAYIQAMLLYNFSFLDNSLYSPYSSPIIIRVGFMF